MLGKPPAVLQLHLGFGSGFGGSLGLIITIKFPFCASSLMAGLRLQMLVHVRWLPSWYGCRAPVCVGSRRQPGGCPGRGFITFLKCL